MKLLLTIFSFGLCSALHAQTMYTYVEPDPALEADKKSKEAYFRQLRDDAFTNWTNCSKQCGSHAADANNPDPCGKSDPINVCLCACATKYQSSISEINKREQDWLKTAAQRQKDYENKKIKEQQGALDKQNKLQQEQNFQNQQKAIAEQKLNEVQQQLADQQHRYQQTQIELDNAKNVSMNAYQEAINNGKKESGAMLDATLAGAQQISDANSQLIYTGIGLGISLFTHLSEKKAEKNAQIMAQQQENLRTKLIIETKSLFIKDLQNINKYTIQDLVNKKRFAVLLILPKQFTDDNQKIYFTLPTLISAYSDSSYPSKEEIKTKLMGYISSELKQNKSFLVLFPIINVEEFQKDFIKKIGSGNVIYLNAQLVNFIKLPNNSNQNNETDFWGNPIKKQSTEKKDNSFWNQ